MTPTIARTSEELRRHTSGGTVALVPTMGALHDGHVELMTYARPLADTLVASIFVNPTQFGPGEDFDSYPRTFDADLERCAEAGVDVVFAPSVTTMYPCGTDNAVTVSPGPLGSILEGAQRPTHFAGVLTVVAKLFGLVQPDVAVFGEKDYQQLVLIKRMVADLCLPVRIEGCPIVRETDGLAMSSRNRYLTDSERELSAVLSRALTAAAEATANGADFDTAVNAAAKILADAGVDPDYLTLTSADLGAPTPGQPARLLVAARIGTPRLLDNIAL
jgi:pantoate--beta-alanine ligase